MELILYLVPAVLVTAIPAQALGLVAYLLLRRHSLSAARAAGTLLPALAVLLLFGVPFVQSLNSPPSQIILLEGAVRLVWLMLAILGTLFHLACAAAVQYALRRRAARRALP